MSRAVFPMRRAVLRSAAALPCLVLQWHPVRAQDDALEAAVRRFANGAPVRNGRVSLDIAALVDNGNTVPVVLTADSPMTASDHVTELALFTQRNPLPEVAVFHLGPRNGRAQVATRIRLATSQDVAVLARMNDGSLWQQRVAVLVTLAACIE